MKKYLQNPEDVIEALRSGKEVKVEDGGEGRIALIDGFVVKNTINGFHINYTINQRDKPYIEEEAPIKLETGKFYRTRNGSKAYCFYREEGGLYPNHCAIDNGNWDKYTDDGLTCFNEETCFDIVGCLEEE